MTINNSLITWLPIPFNPEQKDNTWNSLYFGFVCMPKKQQHIFKSPQAHNLNN